MESDEVEVGGLCGLADGALDPVRSAKLRCQMPVPTPQRFSGVELFRLTGAGGQDDGVRPVGTCHW
ncbi:hypothetical protein GCM10010442_50070 [Kitasatospora kifunensis]